MIILQQATSKLEQNLKQQASTPCVGAYLSCVSTISLSNVLGSCLWFGLMHLTKCGDADMMRCMRSARDPLKCLLTVGGRFVGLAPCESFDDGGFCDDM
jgi:hypothetical protein